MSEVLPDPSRSAEESATMQRVVDKMTRLLAIAAASATMQAGIVSLTPPRDNIMGYYSDYEGTLVQRLTLQQLAVATTGLAHKGAALFCALLRDLDAHYGHTVRRIHLIVDNYAIHSARATVRTLEELGGRIVLHFLPPYCPDANRIERVWQDFHANVTRNHRCKTMKALLGKARDYLDRYVWRRVTGAAPVMSSRWTPISGSMMLFENRAR